MAWHRATSKQEKEFDVEAARKQPCYAAGCTLPVIGGRMTDDGLQIHFCEWHFAEDFMAQIDEEDKEEALKELADLLMMVSSKQNPQQRVWH